jgi:TonB family protein
VSVDGCYKVLVPLACLICADVALTDETPPAAFRDPTRIGSMTPAAKSELLRCVAEAAQTAGDGKDRRAMVGVYIGSNGRPVSLAILESSGLEQLDKLVLRCFLRAEYTPAAPHKPPAQWIFTTSLGAKRVAPAKSRGEIALFHVSPAEAHVRVRLTIVGGAHEA